MRKVPLWQVHFDLIGVLDGTVNVVTDTAEDAILIARQAVESDGVSVFHLMSVVPVFDQEKKRVQILWEDTPSTSAAPVHVVEHEGKRYEAGAKMPTMELVQDSADETTPRDPVNTDADKTGAGLIQQARDEANEMIKTGKIDPYLTKEKPKNGGH